MYGRYTKDLSEYAKDEARRLKQLERQRKKDDRARNKVNFHCTLHKMMRFVGHVKAMIFYVFINALTMKLD